MPMSKSQLLTKLKQTAKGAWKKSREVTPKARGGGGLPPGLKNVVAVARGWKFAETKNGDPFLALTGVIVDYEGLENRRFTIMWFINESEWASVQDNLEQLANDVALLLTADEQLPEGVEGMLEVLQQVVEEGRHFLINTGRERNKGKPPNIFIQGLADGYENDPTTDENKAESGDRNNRRGASASGSKATGRGGSNQQDEAETPSNLGEKEVDDDQNDAGGGDEVVDEAVEEPVEEAVADPDPEVGNDFYFKVTGGANKGKKLVVTVEKVDKRKKMVDVITKATKPKVRYKGIKWDDLLGE